MKKETFKEIKNKQKIGLKNGRKELKKWFQKPLNIQDFDLAKEYKKLDEIEYRLAIRWYDFIPIVGLWTYFIFKELPFGFREVIPTKGSYDSSSLEQLENYFQKRKNIFEYNYYKVSKALLIFCFFIFPIFLITILMFLFPWLDWLIFSLVIKRSRKDLDRFKLQKV